MKLDVYKRKGVDSRIFVLVPNGQPYPDAAKAVIPDPIKFKTIDLERRRTKSEYQDILEQIAKNGFAVTEVVYYSETRVFSTKGHDCTVF